jgi:phosphocarrier protein HPr
MTAFSDPVSNPIPRQSVTASAPLRHAAGLHARPAVKVTKLAKKFASKVSLAASAEGPWIDAKSIVKLMAAKIPRDSLLVFRADGADAQAAVDALVSLVERDFPDEP